MQLFQIYIERHCKACIDHIEVRIMKVGNITQVLHGSNETTYALSCALIAIALAADAAILVDLETARGIRMANDQGRMLCGLVAGLLQTRLQLVQTILALGAHEAGEGAARESERDRER